MIQSEYPKLILASASVARAAVLRAAGIAFETRAAAVDEAAVKLAGRAEGATPDETALLLADLKAQRIARTEPEALVIGADQLLVCGDRWFDKPADLGVARENLWALRGRTHVLVTAIVLRRGGRRVFHHVSRPTMTMRSFTDTFLESYLAAEGDALRGSVGAYRIEGLGGPPVRCSRRRAQRNHGSADSAADGFSAAARSSSGLIENTQRHVAEDRALIGRPALKRHAMRRFRPFPGRRQICRPFLPAMSAAKFQSRRITVMLLNTVVAKPPPRRLTLGPHWPARDNW